MRNRHLLCIAALSLAIPILAQQPTFDVAVIRQSAPDATGTNFMLSASRLAITNAPLTDLIQFAWDLKTSQQVPKSPAWIAAEKFNVDATLSPADVDALNKLPGDQKLEQFRLRVRALLEDRFNLRASLQSKDMPVYALVLAKGGPKPALEPVPAATLTQRTPTLGGFGSGQVKAGTVTMATFADWISGRPEVDGRPVVDETGLNGSFNFQLAWTPPGSRDNGASPSASAVDAVSFLTALEEQLGLKLESRHAPVQVLVIDHVDLPTPN